MGTLEKIAGGLGAVAGVFDQLTPDLGDLVEEICDTVLPEVVGDVLSLGVNVASGNYAAAVADGLDLLENVVRRSPHDRAAAEPAVDPGPPPEETIFLAREETTFATAPEPARGRGTAIDDSFWGQTDDQLTRAIRNGAIPQEVLDSKDGMLRLQQRMNDIQQMNALMTNLLRAMHDMEMEIIRHVRA